MKIYNRKSKEWVEFKDFLQQWKVGMEKVTPLQQTIVTLMGQWISMIGIAWGIIFSIMLAYWWMMVILIGGVIVLGTQILGTWQKKQVLKMMEDSFNNATEKEVLEDEFNGLD